MPPCLGDGDRFSLEALRHIHKQLDDDNDGGIEVNESVEVRFVRERISVCYFGSQDKTKKIQRSDLKVEVSDDIVLR